MFYCLIFCFFCICLLFKKKKKKENGFAMISCTTLCANIYFQDHFSSVLKCYTTSIRQYLALYISGAVCGIVQNLLKGNKRSRTNPTNGAKLQQQQQHTLLEFDTWLRLLPTKSLKVNHPSTTCRSFPMLSAIWSVSWMIYNECMDVMKKNTVKNIFFKSQNNPAIDWGNKRFNGYSRSRR